MKLRGAAVGVSLVLVLVLSAADAVHQKKDTSVYGFDDPFEKNQEWTSQASGCNCDKIVVKLRSVRAKVYNILSMFDKLLKIQVDLKQIKTTIGIVNIALTNIGNSLANGESQISALEPLITNVTQNMAVAKSSVVNLLTKQYLIEALGPYKCTGKNAPSELDEIVYDSCQDARIEKTGVYKISANFDKPTYVMCTLDFGNNAWTVIQNRYDGSENFFRPWSHYKKGFGFFGHGEYWLGLDNIYALTSNSDHELLILLEDFDGKFVYAKYKIFKIENEKDSYRVSKLHGYIGNAGNSFQDVEGMKFSTYDSDHDKSDQNCAELNHGAWWYRACGDTNLNGAYRSKYTPDTSGMYWRDFRGVNYSVKRTRIMVRSKHGHHHSSHHHKF